ncbi:hypothetical protein AXG93_2175s1870 [Marchantia polymorpha subsp. ruderalis]|uniref:Uncharacterized protein n=1 Tax=Marchantia polymorpha subsp. ruderalis TaxID=1480154 RepID=A0A176W7A2_MARPO|nr:hypothetical protein AXG93_2175s1870 [Marchantia polymorpha subsp. ruderalis]
MGDAMRGAHFRLSPAQKQRMLVAQERCRDAAGSVHSSAFVNVGDTIPVDYENGYLRGHGTQVVDGQLLATVCGVVERVNKLVSVRPLRARYNPETGDVVVGRVTESISSSMSNSCISEGFIFYFSDVQKGRVSHQHILLSPMTGSGKEVNDSAVLELLLDFEFNSQVAPKRWKVDVNSRQDAQLMLSAVNLPGGIQRRRTATDELNMRDLFTENDLISAEVQTLHQDGSLHLHTRSLKYGKLESGQLVKVAPYLIKRLKQHFHQLKQYGVQMILGCNGYVWISALPQSTPDIATDQKRANTESLEAAAGTADSQNVEISRELRERICRLANVVRVLGACGFLIHPDSIVDTYEASLSWGTELKHMFSGEFFVKVVEREAEQRSKKGAMKALISAMTHVLGTNLGVAQPVIVKP